MNPTLRNVIVLVAAALAFAVLAGCEPPLEGDGGTWVCNFMTDGDAFWSADPAWYVDPGDMGETGNYAFCLVDPSWDIPTPVSARYFSFAPHYTASPPDDNRYYEVAQGNGDYADQDFYQTVPGIRLNDINTCRLVRAGNVITTSMNGTFIDTETIDPLNQPSVGYAPLIHGHGSWDVADSNFFIRKLTVTCLPGERVNHDWNP
jgi:hypothetical protein